MASPNSTFTELVTTTFRKHRKEIKDNLSNRNALLKEVCSNSYWTAKEACEDKVAFVCIST
jgi:hypothetical protein